VPARLKPLGATQRGPRPQRRVPLDVPPMPHGLGKARKSTKEWWEAWFTSGRASLLDDAGLAQLSRVAGMLDEAERAESPSLRLRLRTEVRRQETALSRDVTKSAPAVDADATERRAEHRREMEAGRLQRVADADRLGISIAELELLPLSSDDFTVHTPMSSSTQTKEPTA
jgi:hypothetical protein